MLVLLVQLVKAKVAFLGTANIPILAALIVLGTTGSLITVTMPAAGDEDDDRAFKVVVTPLESKTCIDALIAQTEALLQLDALAADTAVQLHQLREAARERAEDQHKMIDEAALRTQYNTFAAKIPTALATARAQVLDAADLGKCQDRDPNTTVDVNVTALRARYDAIVAAFGQTMNGILTDAQAAFDQLVATAQPRPKRHHDDDEDEDEDD